MSGGEEDRGDLNGGRGVGWGVNGFDLNFFELFGADWADCVRMHMCGEGRDTKEGKG